MYVAATPVMPVNGVPSEAYLRRVGLAGMGDWDVYGPETPVSSGGGTWDWIKDLSSSVLEKIQLPGFGTPKVDPGTVITTTESGQVLYRQESGYPVTSVPTTVGYPEVSGTLKAQTDTGTGLVIAGAGLAALVVLAMVMKK